MLEDFKPNLLLNVSLLYAYIQILLKQIHMFKKRHEIAANLLLKQVRTFKKISLDFRLIFAFRKYGVHKCAWTNKLESNSRYKFWSIYILGH
jgi:hypothetical protein